MIHQALREGIDLVECDIVSPTCDTCALYQGRVYSISGKDSRYPSLYKTAFKSGYSIIHPNCRHSWSPYHEELYSDEQKRDMMDQSNRSWKPDGDGRSFQQTERMRAEYARGQALMRQWNGELVEFERMKAYYKAQGQDPPYKTLGAFRRETRNPRGEQSTAMQSWKRHYADSQQYERWKEVVGTENMPKTLDKFQKMKYNNTKQFNVLNRTVLDERTRRKIGTADFPITLHEDRQGKHIRGHKNFQSNKSYLAVDTVEEGQRLAQVLVEQYNGRGTFRRDSQGRWKNTERVVTDRIVGYVKGLDGKWTPTKAMTIHYSKTGTHIVPTIMKEDKE